LYTLIYSFRHLWRMRIRRILSDKIIIISILLISGIIYAILRYFVFHSDPLISVVSSLLRFYLTLAGNVADQFLHLTGSEATINHDIFVPDDEGLFSYLALIRYKKIPFIILVFIWITRTPIKEKVLFTFFLGLVHFFLVSGYFGVVTYITAIDENSGYVLSKIYHLISLLSLFTFLTIWILKKKEAIRDALVKYKVISGIFDDKAIPVLIAIYFYLIIDNFPVEYFNYLPWINILFSSSQKILNIFGYEAIVEPFSLVGSNGYIIMHKGCLGIGAMFLFASIVFLTGRNDIRRWLYIIAGIIFLNFVNILRFVFLFIHIQKNGDYKLAMDVHTMYDYIIYLIIFIMWIIWIEKYSDIKPSGK
jgi:exosortase/archaeosortase family protein